MYDFKDKEKGEGIVKFVDTLCNETPEIAFELLSVPIKYVHTWLSKEYGNGDHIGTRGVGMSAVEIAKLPCGCLIGATFIATCRMYPEIVESVDEIEVGFDAEALTNAVLRNLPNALMVVDGDFGGMTANEIHQVGLDVSNQVQSWEELEFEQFVKDRIRENLGITSIIVEV